MDRKQEDSALVRCSGPDLDPDSPGPKGMALDGLTCDGSLTGMMGGGTSDETSSLAGVCGKGGAVSVYASVNSL